MLWSRKLVSKSTEDFFLDKRWTPILSIAPTILYEVMNITFSNIGHKHTSHSDGTGLGTWVGGPKVSPKRIKYS